MSVKLITDNWHYDGNINELIEEIYQQTYAIIEDKACEILQKVGLHKFKNLELEDYSGTYWGKISKLSAERRDLIGLCAYMVSKLDKVRLTGREYKTFKNYFINCGDSAEITRLIELSRIDHDIQQGQTHDDFDDELEEELRRARLKVLLDH